MRFTYAKRNACLSMCGALTKNPRPRYEKLTRHSSRCCKLRQARCMPEPKQRRRQSSQLWFVGPGHPPADWSPLPMKAIHIHHVPAICFFQTLDEFSKISTLRSDPEVKPNPPIPVGPPTTSADIPPKFPLAILRPPHMQTWCPRKSPAPKTVLPDSPSSTICKMREHGHEVSRKSAPNRKCARVTFGHLSCGFQHPDPSARFVDGCQGAIGAMH